MAFPSAIFDGEACAGDGHESIQALFIERNCKGDRRKRLKDCWRAASSRRSSPYTLRRV